MLSERQLVASNLWKAVRTNGAPGLSSRVAREYTLLLLAAHLIAGRPDSPFIPMHHRRPTEGAPYDIVRSASSLLNQLDSYDHQMPDSLERAWHEYLLEMDRWLSRGSVRMQLSERAEEQILQIGKLINVLMSEHPRETWLYVFDFIFRSDGERGHLGPGAQRRGMAEFAATLAVSDHKVAELSSWCGDIAVLLSSTPDADSPEFIIEGEELDRQETIWLLRLAIFGVSVSLREKALSRSNFLVVDVGELYTHYRRQSQQDRVISRVIALLPEQGLAVLFVSPEFLRLKAASFLFEELVRSGRMRASVRLRAGGNARRGRITAWVISRNRISASTLMMDLLEVDSIGHFSSVESIARFAAFTVLQSMGAPFPKVASFQIPDTEAQAVDTILKRRFKDGYADIPGVSARVTIDQIGLQNFTSDPSRYIQTELDTSAFERLDARPLESVLALRDRGPSRFYIIGDNGEGKSHYLRLLAAETASSGQTTVGLSSNIWDRFDFPHSENPESRFVYMGTRTSKSGVDGVRSGRKLLERFELLSTDERRLAAFRSVLSQIGLSDTIYLVSRRGSYSSVAADSLENSRRLSGIASDNEEIFRAIEKKNFRVAFKHKRSSDAIVPFDELSSGEQQVISLIVKLVLGSDRGRLILIDEPEASLHVGWQRALPQILEEVSTRFSCDMVVATHSAVMVSSARASSDYCFSARDGEVVPIQVGDRKSVDGVLINGFRTYTPYGKELYEQCARIVSQAIEDANATDPTEDSVTPLLEQLSRLRRIAEGDGNALDQESKGRDIDLIEMARTAIQHLSKSKSNAGA